MAPQMTFREARFWTLVCLGCAVVFLIIEESVLP